MFEPAVDGLGGTVGCAGAVEEREDVAGASVECAAQASHLDQRGWHTGA